MINVILRYCFVFVFLPGFMLGSNTKVYGQGNEDLMTNVYNQPLKTFPQHTYMGKRINLKAT